MRNTPLDLLFGEPAWCAYSRDLSVKIEAAFQKYMRCGEKTILSQPKVDDGHFLNFKNMRQYDLYDNKRWLMVRRDAEASFEDRVWFKDMRSDPSGEGEPVWKQFSFIESQIIDKHY